MASDYYKLFEVDTSTDNIKTLREEIKLLKGELEELTIGSEEYEKVSDQIFSKQSRLKEVMRDTSRPIEDAEGSFNALNARLRQLKEEWKATGDEVRRAELTKEVNEVKDKLNSMNESIGNYQHNVGNYTQGIIDAFGKMGLSLGKTGQSIIGVFTSMGTGVAGLGSAFKGLWAIISTNPLGILLSALGAIIGAFAGVKRAINENEDSQRRYNEATASFRPIADGFTNALDKVAQGFVSLVEVLAQAYDWLHRNLAAYMDWIGATKGGYERVVQEQQFYKALAQEENKIIDLRRTTERLNNTDRDRLSLLREEAALEVDKTKRTAMLREARDLQIAINKRDEELAQNEYELLKKQSEMTSNSVEVNNQLLDAEQRVLQVRAQGRLALIRLNNQIRSGTEATKENTEATKENEAIRKKMLAAAEEERKQAENIYKESLAALKTQTQLEEEEYKKRRQLLEDYNLSTEALDKEHAKRLREQQAEAYRLDVEYAKERLEHEEEMRRSARERQEQPNVLDIEAIIEANNAELEAEKEFINAKIALNEALMLSYAEGSEERARLERENALLHEEILNAEYAADKKNTEAYKKLQEARYKAVDSMAKGTSNILKAVSNAMGENTKAAKGFAIAAATIDTIQASIAGFKAGYNQWKDAGPLAFMAPIQGAINATAALAAGFAQVQQIRSVDPNGNGGGQGTATALAIPNIAGLSSPIDYTRQVTTEQEREELNRDTRVYILESDIQASNRRVQIREDESSF